MPKRRVTPRICSPVQTSGMRQASSIVSVLSRTGSPRPAPNCEAIAQSTNIHELLAKREGLFSTRITKIVEYPDGAILTCDKHDAIRGEGYVIGYHHPGKGFRWV